MDMIKGLINKVTGDDGRLDANDLRAQAGDLGLDDLKDLNFPVTKPEVLDILRRNNASDLLIQGVERIPQSTFQDMNDLRSKLPF